LALVDAIVKAIFQIYTRFAKPLFIVAPFVRMFCCCAPAAAIVQATCETMRRFHSMMETKEDFYSFFFTKDFPLHIRLLPFF
jgi:hypothetical protein